MQQSNARTGKQAHLSKDTEVLTPNVCCLLVNHLYGHLLAVGPASEGVHLYTRCSTFEVLMTRRQVSNVQQAEFPLNACAKRITRRLCVFATLKL